MHYKFNLKSIRLEMFLTYKETSIQEHQIIACFRRLHVRFKLSDNESQST